MLAGLRQCTLVGSQRGVPAQCPCSSCLPFLDSLLAEQHAAPRPDSMLLSPHLTSHSHSHCTCITDPWLCPTSFPTLQHNAAFALYGLSDNEDNLLEFVREGAVQRINECELVVQASKDCVNKLMKRLQVGGGWGWWLGICGGRGGLGAASRPRSVWAGTCCCRLSKQARGPGEQGGASAHTTTVSSMHCPVLTCASKLLPWLPGPDTCIVLSTLDLPLTCTRSSPLDIPLTGLPPRLLPLPTRLLPLVPQDKLSTRILGQILYIMQSSQTGGKQRIAVALSQLTSREQPSGAQMRLMFLEKRGLEYLLDIVQVGGCTQCMVGVLVHACGGACVCVCECVCVRGLLQGVCWQVMATPALPLCACCHACLCPRTPTSATPPLTSLPLPPHPLSFIRLTPAPSPFVQDPHMPVDMQRSGAKSLHRLAESCGAADRASVEDLMPKEPTVCEVGGWLAGWLRVAGWLAWVAGWLAGLGGL